MTRRKIGDALGGDLFPSKLLASTDAQLLLDTIAYGLDRSEIALFWKDREGRFLAANDVFCRVCGIDDPNEMVGKTDFDLFDHDVAVGFSEVDVEVMETGLPVLNYIEQIETADGRQETLHTSKVPVRDNNGEIVAMMGCFHAVTTVVEAEQALRTLEGRYSVALDASRDGMWELDLANEQLEVSPRFMELLEVDTQPRDGRQFDSEQVRQLLGPDLIKIRAEVFSLIQENGVLSFQHERRMPNGSTRWFHVSGLPFVDEQGVTTHVIGTLVDITNRVERERDLIFKASHDDLTGLHNRRSLLEYLEGERQAGEPLSLLYLDLDEFKLVNDSLGHQVGDELLRAMAERLDALTRPDQMLARLGGDEFAIVAANTSPENAEALAQRVVDELSESLVLEETEIYITCSVGVVHCTDAHNSSLEILRDGDIALYNAKSAGKTCVRIFETSMRVTADAALALQNQIRGAVERDQFVMHYQPIVDAQTDVVSGVEALIRWRRQDGELINAGTFLPFLEQTGLMIEVGEWLIRETVGQLAQWRDHHPSARDLTLSVNLSRMQFRSPRLCDVIMDALALHGVPHENLVVEVTETAIADNVEVVVKTLDHLRSIGVRVAIDDFGIGQSSLSSLHELPLDILKIDQSFVARIDGPGSQPMIDTMLVIAEAVGLRSTAEGVETEAQRQYLKQAGCEHIQGFLLGKAMEPEEFANLFLDDVGQIAA